MRGRTGFRVVFGLLVLFFVLQAAPLLGQEDGGLIDDFEADDFADRWWFWTDDTEFLCEFIEPGYNSEHSLWLMFNVSPGSWPACAMDVSDPQRWAAAGGLSFVWRSDRPGLYMEVTVDTLDPTQTNPESEGYTPFYVALETPGSVWTPVTLPWSAFVKEEWVGETGTNTLDVTQAVALYFISGDAQAGIIWIDDLRLIGGETPPSPTGFDKFALWAEGTQLRGANIWQRVVVPELDGDQFLGSGQVGPPFTQEDFDRLAALGANYVNISGPGLFTETPPYVLDEAVQGNLDKTLAMIANADMFAVITFRTGPGRSDFTFYRDGAGDWFPESLLIEWMWQDQTAQDAWVDMWRYTAQRYRNHPVVVGYDLMCQPNSAGALLEIWDPEEFYANYGGTLYDWNALYPRIVSAIREVDTDTPILVGGMGWSAVWWLPYLDTVDDPRVVYVAHQYEPQDQYTHQDSSGVNTYPGWFDLDWDGVADEFNRDWLDGYLGIIDDFQAEHRVPVAINEFGVRRWVPNAAGFMRDQLDLFEARGLNHALWVFQPDWPPFTDTVNEFNFLYGPNPDNHTVVETSELLEVIRANWSRNTIRPSAVEP